MPGRRAILQAAVGALALGATGASAKSRAGKRINDISTLNPVDVAREVTPRTTEEVQRALSKWSGAVSVGGARYSMGGQIAAPGSLHVDMRGMHRVLWHNVPGKAIRVQAGATWRSIQDRIDLANQSVRIMQSYSSFSVGGSLSVNCHGRYVGRGPVVNSVRALQVVLADGSVVEASRSANTELFRAAIGGYGAIGIITEVELDLDDNGKIERVVEPVGLEDYPDYFRRSVESDADVVLHNADLTPPGFDQPVATTWRRTDRALTETTRLVPRGMSYAREQNAIWAITELPGGDSLRSLAEKRLRAPAVVWRNYEASLDAAMLEPRTRAMSTYLLQEYFIPVGAFHGFAIGMARILRERQTGALNVSIRHSPPDPVTLMRWAPTEVFSFVLYYKQRSTQAASRAVARWTRELIDLALAHGGRYYLPYRLHATRQQFARAYPEAREFARLKAQVDPKRRLRNLMWDRYLL